MSSLGNYAPSYTVFFLIISWNRGHTSSGPDDPLVPHLLLSRCRVSSPSGERRKEREQRETRSCKGRGGNTAPRFFMLQSGQPLWSGGCSPPRASFWPMAKGHTCGLSSVFSEAHVLRKNRFPLCFAACGRQNSAEGFFLYKKRFPSCVDFTFFDRLKTADSCLRSLSVVTPQRCRGR